MNEKIRDLRIVEVNNRTYLGIIKKDDVWGEILTDAYDCGAECDFDGEDIMGWFKSFNLVGNLIERVKLIGSIGYTVRGFDVHEKRYVDKCVLAMTDAIRWTVPTMQNEYFVKALK